MPPSSTPLIINWLMRSRQAALKEKRQKRRESHNAVERRRRDNINEKIQELAAIIPDEFMTPASAIHGQSSPLGASPATHHAPDGTIKHNKGIILRKSVDYIRSLQDVVKESQRRAKRLEEEVKRLGGDPKSVDQDESRRESMTNLEDEESWLDEALIGDDSPGMMMD
jgi:Helix-loop-helix DNA-binding domain